MSLDQDEVDCLWAAGFVISVVQKKEQQAVEK